MDPQKGGGGEEDRGKKDEEGPLSDGDSQPSGANPMETLERLMRQLSPWQQGGEDEDAVKPEQLLEEITLEGIVKYIKSDRCKNVIVMTGAGISTSAGIPDFRSPGTGLYDNLEKYNLPNPMAIFDISYFKEKPEPFFYLAKELYPGKFKPTPCHYFIKLLADKKLLLRNYTQNIDTLERIAGVPGELMMEAHGTFYTGHCLGECRKEYTQQWMKDEIFADRLPKCAECGGVVKPDIVFFGEALPPRFSKLVMEDFPQCDLLIVMGTSLVVQPFASLLERVSDTTPRLLINKEKAGESHPLMRQLGLGGAGFEFDPEQNYRDVAFLGTCDDGCYKLAELLGWKDELEKLVQTEHERIDGEAASSTGESAQGEAASSTGESAQGEAASSTGESAQGEAASSTGESAQGEAASSTGESAQGEAASSTGESAQGEAASSTGESAQGEAASSTGESAQGKPDKTASPKQIASP